MSKRFLTAILTVLLSQMVIIQPSQSEENHYDPYKGRSIKGPKNYKLYRVNQTEPGLGAVVAMLQVDARGINLTADQKGLGALNFSDLENLWGKNPSGFRSQSVFNLKDKDYSFDIIVNFEKNVPYKQARVIKYQVIQKSIGKSNWIDTKILSDCPFRIDKLTATLSGNRCVLKAEPTLKQADGDKLPKAYYLFPYQSIFQNPNEQLKIVQTPYLQILEDGQTKFLILSGPTAASDVKIGEMTIEDAERIFGKSKRNSDDTVTFHLVGTDTEPNIFHLDTKFENGLICSYLIRGNRISKPEWKSTD